MKGELFIDISSGHWTVELAFSGPVVWHFRRSGEKVEFEWAQFDGYRSLQTTQEVILSNFEFKVSPYLMNNTPDLGRTQHYTADEFKMTQLLATQVLPIGFPLGITPNKGLWKNTGGILVSADIFGKASIPSRAVQGVNVWPPASPTQPGTIYNTTRLRGQPLTQPIILDDVLNIEDTVKIECECGFIKHNWTEGHSNFCQMLNLGRWYRPASK